MGDSVMRATGWMTRIESLVAKALTASSAGLTAVFALKNKGRVQSGALDDQNAPNEVILAAAIPKPKASGIFLVTAAWFGTTSAADTVGLDIAQIAAETAFSGGTVSPDGNWRVAEAGAVTATGGGATIKVAENSVTVGAGAATHVAVSGFADFSGALATPDVILVRVRCTNNLTLQTVNCSFFELP